MKNTNKREVKKEKTVKKCTCIEYNNGGEIVMIINDCPIHDELFGHNAKLTLTPQNKREERNKIIKARE